MLLAILKILITLGQAYTIYNGELLYPNYYQIEVIDRLLFKLDSEKLINTKTDHFKFIGIGYGGFILQSYSKQFNHLELEVTWKFVI